MHTRQFCQTLSLAAAVAVAVGLAACAGSDKPAWQPIIRQPAGKATPSAPGVRPKPGVPAAGVNPYLWRAALESVSFMPLATADSGGGVIITDWYSAATAPHERAKLNVLITGKTLQPASLKVSMFKQTRLNANAEWQNIAIAPATEQQLADAIITKARTLRVKATVPQPR